MAKMTSDNFQKGFLVDDRCLGGVALTDEGQFAAYVLDHTEGEYLHYMLHPTSEAAIAELNAMDRSWAYESTSACGTGQCGEGAQCGTGLCPKVTPCSTA